MNKVLQIEKIMKLMKKDTGSLVRRLSAVLLAAALCLGSLNGCGNNGSNTKVVLTTGFEKDEVFRIENISCRLPEIMVYLTNFQNQYESVYGTEIWNAKVEGITLEQNVKDTTLARIAQIKTMNLLAKEHEVELSSQEKGLVEEAAAAYYNSLNEIEIEQMGVTEETILQLYSEYVLANKVYNFIIRDINPEISDDEARTITVQHVLIKTYALDGSGGKIEYTEDAKAAAYAKAQEVLELAVAGSDFEELIQQYSEDNKGTYSFGKGDMEPDFENAAFNLETSEISGIVETKFGYHIIKCISTFDRAETDINKVKIVEERKKEVFGQEYDSFVRSLVRDLNEELWSSVAFIHNQEVITEDFFDIYGKYFEK